MARALQMGWIKAGCSSRQANLGSANPGRARRQGWSSHKRIGGSASTDSGHLWFVRGSTMIGLVDRLMMQREGRASPAICIVLRSRFLYSALSFYLLTLFVLERESNQIISRFLRTSISYFVRRHST
ncbi:hypothetical protein BU24DRAFT_236105 [Aaosphaeria arxii CBS 175.79]|uniref:Uncharacterized protein n=1 Tax=Aaosphaeria arxii CBS 175.79 TaxID=1450172 RepID=A0A6A5XJC6_9PLEO|nr:uncharacterized protein BU24DRAFT_236105 [Aaosphaeria arxii CBS 175.79]KAF2013368.1 hypothetical protein BU24DRAFT_236105 [Aaosphaeria arxii CBS 175.79]